MDSSTLCQEEKELVDAYHNILSHMFHYYNSMALKCAVKLGIPDTIQKHGKPMTVNELATSLSIHPNKAASLPRLMSHLVISNFFCKETSDNGDESYALTLSSKLLLKDHPLSQAPFVVGILQTPKVNASNYLSDWFQNDAESPFYTANGKGFWDFATDDLEFSFLFNKAMENSSRFIMNVLVNSNIFKGLFEGIHTLVDVGGGNGTTLEIISKAYPWLKCTVFDQPQVIQGLQESGGKLNYVAGDMFEAIPHAEVLLLKWILHDWSDEECVKILQRCKEAIPQGGKVIIIEAVVEKPKNDEPETSTNVISMFDVHMMSIFGEGKERSKDQWEKLFVEAGFGDYKILPIPGVMSVFEVYPL